ncbi:MAG: 6-phospho-3-hexuloisomerase [Sulfolobales archaeon]
MLNKSFVRQREIKYLKNIMRDIANFVLKTAEVISEDQISKALELLEEAYRNRRTILVMGAGRSGLVGRAFGMRLMHLGFNVFVLGDTIVPPVRKDDVVVAISGSGRTKLIVTAAEAAKSVGAKILTITSYPDSPLAQLSDVVVVIPGRTKVSAEEDYFARQILGIHEPLAPLGTLFEDTAMIFLDSLIVELMHVLDVSEKDMSSRHANIEL